MVYRLRILHLSDLHERVALDWMPEKRKRKIRLTAASRARVLDESNFSEALAALRETGHIDIVCFTGDVADWGLEAEYSACTARIRNILTVTDVPIDRLFIVPGNHDIARSCQADAWMELRQLAAAQPVALSRWMAGLEAPAGANAAWRDAILARSSAFWGWVENDLRLGELVPARNAHGRLGYQRSIQLPHLPFPVNVIGLDSAWLAGDDHDARKLRLTDDQIDMLTRDEAGKQLEGFRLALMHHPLGDLADERSALVRLSETVDLLLHGHQHDPINEDRRDPDRSLQVLAAGSLYEGDEGDRWINGFHAIDIELNARGKPLRYDVRFWAWSERGHWYPSGAIYKSAPHGVLTIKLVGMRDSEVAPPPDPLSYFISRKEPFDTIKMKLLTGTQKAHALVGMPCVGKSTIAVELARDPDVKRAFTEIFWITLGQEDTLLLATMRGLLRSCGDSHPPADDLVEAARRLQDALRNRNTLLVLDDAWRAADVRLFVCPGRSKIVFTTRDLAVAEAVDAASYTVNPLTPQESIELIERRLDRPLATRDRELAEDVAEEVGWLPLSIVAACARIEEGDSWDVLVTDLKDERKRLQALEPPEFGETISSRSVAAAFQLSIRTLIAEESERFALLSLLAEDVVFTADVAANLWHVAPDEAELSLRRLRRKGLVLPHIYGSNKRGYQLHDEQRNAGRRILKLTPAQCHRRLIEEYRRVDPVLWTIPNDGYLHNHLSWHLLQGGMTDELHHLLAEEVNDKNAWYSARGGQLDGYLDDLQRAASQAAGLPAKQARYAMMQSSVASLGSNVPLVLLTELVKREIWSEDRAWGHVMSLPLSERFNALCSLLSMLQAPYISRCFDVILKDIRSNTEIQRRDYMFGHIPLNVLTAEQVDCLLQTAKRCEEGSATATSMALRQFASTNRLDELFQELRLLDEKTDLGSHYGTEWTTPKLVSYAQLPALLPKEGIERLLATYPGEAELERQASERLAELGQYDEALAIAQCLPDNYSRVSAIKAIAPLLREDQIKALETAASSLSNERHRIEALGAVYDRYQDPLRTELIEDLWSLCREKDLFVLTPYLPHKLAGRIKRLPDDNEGGIQMVKRLVELGLVKQALKLVGPPNRHINSELKEIAKVLDESELLRLGVDADETDPWVRGALLPRWAELDHGPETATLLSRLAGEPYVFESTVNRIAPKLDVASLKAVLAISEAIGDEARSRCFRARLALAAPDDLSADLSSMPLQEILGHSFIHAAAQSMSESQAERLRSCFTSPIYRLAISVAHDGLAERFLLEDAAAVPEQLRKVFEDIKGLPLSDWGERYCDLRGAMVYFIRGLEICTGRHRQALIMLTRRVVTHFGLDEPRICAAVYDGAEIISAIGEDTLVERLPDIAAALQGDDRKAIENLVKQRLWGESPYQVINKLSNANELTPALLDFALEQMHSLDQEIGLIGSNLVEHCCRAGRIADALAVMRHIPERYDKSRFYAIVALAIHASPSAATAYLDQAWSMIFRDEYTRRNWNEAAQVEKLIPTVIAQPQLVKERLWQRAVHVLSRRKRSDMFDYLGALVPLIRALGGSEAIVAIARAMGDVVRWWP
jgi:hypothetical protein